MQIRTKAGKKYSAWSKAKIIKTINKTAIKMKTNMNTEQIREEGIQSMKQRTINITRNIICALGILALIILIKPTKVFAFSMNDAKNSPVLTWGSIGRQG